MVSYNVSQSKQFDVTQLKEKRGKGTLIKDLMKEYSLSKASVYRYLGDGGVK